MSLSSSGETNVAYSLAIPERSPTSESEGPSSHIVSPDVSGDATVVTCGGPLAAPESAENVPLHDDQTSQRPRSPVHNSAPPDGAGNSRTFAESAPIAGPL